MTKHPRVTSPDKDVDFTARVDVTHRREWAWEIATTIVGVLFLVMLVYYLWTTPRNGS